MQENIKEVFIRFRSIQHFQLDYRISRSWEITKKQRLQEERSLSREEKTHDRSRTPLQLGGA